MKFVEMVKGYGKDQVYIYAELNNAEIKEKKKEGYRKVFTHNLFTPKKHNKVKSFNKNGIWVI